MAFHAETADELWLDIWNEIRERGIARPHSRQGGSIEILHAVLELSDPRQRWVTARNPAINPAFAIAELVWILRGRNDAEFLNVWNKSLPKFAGDGAVFDGAYGDRLRNRFEFDQLARAASILRSSPEQRQVVLQIWDPRSDMPLDSGAPQSKDVPCNIVSMLKVVDGKLEWLQVMRSNDLIRGLPYNLIQWSTLHEVMAGWIGLDLGTYVHVSDSLHLYEVDRGQFDAVSPAYAKSETDLRLNVEDSDHVFELLDVTISAIAASEHPSTVFKLAGSFHAPGYADWLWVMASERLRRLGELGKSSAALGEVQDPLLHEAQSRWLKRRWLKPL